MQQGPLLVNYSLSTFKHITDNCWTLNSEHRKLVKVDTQKTIFICIIRDDRLNSHGFIKYTAKFMLSRSRLFPLVKSLKRIDLYIKGHVII